MKSQITSKSSRNCLFSAGVIPSRISTSSRRTTYFQHPPSHVLKNLFTVLCLCFFAVKIQAQTNFDVLICRNASYTNATIIRATPAYVVVDHIDGIAKVDIEDLPAPLQTIYHYDPAKAAATLAAEKQARVDALKIEAERRQWLLSLRGTNQYVKINSFTDSGLCETGVGGGGDSAHGGVGKIYIYNLPDSVKNFFTQRDALKSQIEELKSKQIVAWDTSNDGDALGSQMRAEDALADAKEAKAEKLKNLQEQLDALEDDEMTTTTITAFPTGQNYFGTPIWRCVN